MGNTDPERDALDLAAMIDRIYEIASEPAQFDTFIEEWVRRGGFAKAFDDHDLRPHLARANAFMARLEPSEADLPHQLRPYERFAAFIVDGAERIEATNAGAATAFGIAKGGRLADATLPADLLGQLSDILRQMRTAADPGQRLLRFDQDAQRGAVLLRVQRLGDGKSALIVSTHFQWNAASDPLLKDAYGLTQAERQVVRSLVEGLDTRTISARRNTTEGTTRSQIKSILGKMNLRSQADIVRVAVMLGKMPGLEPTELAAPSVQKDWLDREVWKPFTRATLPDGRVQEIHEMGPPDGDPVLLTHLGSCMLRWTAPMLRLVQGLNLRIICPVRAGYGQSSLPAGAYDPFALTTSDTLALLDRLNIDALPYVVQGSDFPLAAHFVAAHPERVTQVISLGGRPCLPGGFQIEGQGAWQRFFLAVSRRTPHLAEFAASATIAMSRRIGPAAMLRSLCKDSPADLALLSDPQVAPVLEANIALFSDKSSQSARAFAREYTAFQSDWSHHASRAAQTTPIKVFLADQDPTFDMRMLPRLRAAYPLIRFETVQEAGLAMIYQHYPELIAQLAQAAKPARQSAL